MNHQEAMRAGRCPDCKTGVLQHGPWSKAEIEAMAKEIGMPCVDFYDCCDDCFVRDVGLGDAAYAQSMCPDRKLVLTHIGAA